MKQPLLSLLLVVTLTAAGTTAAFADDLVRGNGYRLRLPAGFVRAGGERRSDGARIRSRFGSMPIDGLPDVTAFTAGPAEKPAATLLVARVNLKDPIHTHRDLGLRQISAMDARVPAGFEFTAVRVGSNDAIEMAFSSEVDGEAHTSRVLSVACGDFLVVLMLDTADPRYVDADGNWTELVGTLEIIPRSRSLLMVALVGLGVLVLFGLIVRGARLLAGGGARQRARPTHSSGLILPQGRGSSYTPGPGVSSQAEARPPRSSAPARKGLLNTLPGKRR